MRHRPSCGLTSVDLWSCLQSRRSLGAWLGVQTSAEPTACLCRSVQKSNTGNKLLIFSSPCLLFQCWQKYKESGLINTGEVRERKADQIVEVSNSLMVDWYDNQ